MMFDSFATKSYPLSNKGSKHSNELASLISPSLPIDKHGQCHSVSIPIHDDSGDEHSNMIENFDVCRICYSTEDPRSLISPCRCSGTIGQLHRTCLERWLETSNTSQCEICHDQYEIIRYPKSLFFFFSHPLRPSDIRYLIADLILFVLLTMVISWLSMINIGKVQTRQTFDDDSFYTFLSCSIFFVYLVWCSVSFRYHIRVMKEWRSVNQSIRVNSRRKTADHSIMKFDSESEQYAPLTTDNHQSASEEFQRIDTFQAAE